MVTVCVAAVLIPAFHMVHVDMAVVAVAVPYSYTPLYLSLVTSYKCLAIMKMNIISDSYHRYMCKHMGTTVTIK